MTLSRRNRPKVENGTFCSVYGALTGNELARWMLRDHAPARLNLQIHKCIWGPTREGV